MNTTHRLAAGAVALAAALTPAIAIASTSAPAPVPVKAHRTHVRRPMASPVTHYRRAAHRLGSSTSTHAVPAPTPAPPGTKIGPGVRAINRAEDELQTQVSNAGYAAGIPAWVDCLNTAGLPVVATSTGPTAGGWTFGKPTTPRATFLESAAGEDAQDAVVARCMVSTYHLKG